MRKGKTILVEYFWDHEDALKAVGLEEYAVSQENVERHRSFFRTLDPSEWARDENMSSPDTDLMYEGDVLPDQVGENLRVMFHIHDGSVTRVASSWNRERALADLGLET